MPRMVRPLKKLSSAFRGENFMSIAWLWIVGRCGGVDTINMETLENPNSMIKTALRLEHVVKYVEL